MVRDKIKDAYFTPTVLYHLCILQRTKRDVEKFAAKTMSWTGGTQGSKYRPESARDGVYGYFYLLTCNNAHE